MNIAAPLYVFYFLLMIGVGLVCLSFLDKKHDLELSAYECVERALLTNDAHCERSVQAKAQALEASARALMLR